MMDTVALRGQAEALAASLPALLAAAEHLAANVVMGEHGRKRAGTGDDFWQYRPATAGDSARNIDWRRSARSDVQFVREREWQAAQSVMLWVDPSQSMGFSGAPERETKADRARLIALALGVLLLRGGERVGLAGQGAPRSGRGQVARLLLGFADSGVDYGTPVEDGLVAHGRAVFVSDFLGDLVAVEASLARAADRGVRGVLLQVLDPVEEAFPFDGRTVFVSMGGSVSHETQQAGDLKARYLARLAERKARLAELAALSGWLYQTHHTGDAAQVALLWAPRALEGGR
ncbi:MAG: DUF58 domain-containing protein [Microbacteriaceae bacterium]|nr:DUF58 domain-containing protein [Burkholderiaceae bacterium]